MGDVYHYGDAHLYGPRLSGMSVPASEIVAIVPDSTDLGYWVMGANGAVYNRGDAPADGQSSDGHLNAPIVTAAGFWPGDWV